MKRWATGTRLESDMLSQNFIEMTEQDVLGAISAVNFTHMVATTLRDVTKSQNIKDSATDEDVEEKAISDLIVHTLKRQGKYLRLQGEFMLPMRGTNVPSLVRTGAAVEKMRRSGLIAFDWRGTGASRKFFLIKKAIPEDEESEKAAKAILRRLSNDQITLASYLSSFKSPSITSLAFKGSITPAPLPCQIGCDCHKKSNEVNVKDLFTIYRDTNLTFKPASDHVVDDDGRIAVDLNSTPRSPPPTQIRSPTTEDEFEDTPKRGNEGTNNCGGYDIAVRRLPDAPPSQGGNLGSTALTKSKLSDDPRMSTKRFKP